MPIIKDRNTYITPEELKEVEELAEGLTMQQIAEYFGVNRNTFAKIMERQPEVNEHYKKGKSKVIADISSKLVAKARGGDTAAQMFYLKTQARWKESAITIDRREIGRLDNKKALDVIINSIVDSPDKEVDVKALNALNALIKTNIELTEIQDLKERLDAIEENG